LEESENIDEIIENFLIEHNIPYREVKKNYLSQELAFEQLIKELLS
jgi:hypothetical protein